MENLRKRVCWHLINENVHVTCLWKTSADFGLLVALGLGHPVLPTNALRGAVALKNLADVERDDSVQLFHSANERTIIDMVIMSTTHRRRDCNPSSARLDSCDSSTYGSVLAQFIPIIAPPWGHRFSSGRQPKEDTAPETSQWIRIHISLVLVPSRSHFPFRM